MKTIGVMAKSRFKKDMSPRKGHEEAGKKTEFTANPVNRAQMPINYHSHSLPESGNNGIFQTHPVMEPGGSGTRVTDFNGPYTDTTSAGQPSPDTHGSNNMTPSYGVAAAGPYRSPFAPSAPFNYQSPFTPSMPGSANADPASGTTMTSSASETDHRGESQDIVMGGTPSPKECEIITKGGQFQHFEYHHPSQNSEGLASRGIMKQTKTGAKAQRRGPKPASKPAPSDKHARNRASQRAHRLKKEQYMLDMEQDLLVTKHTNVAYRLVSTNLWRTNQRMRDALEAHGIQCDFIDAQDSVPLPSEPFEDASNDGSNPGGKRSTAVQRMLYGLDAYEGDGAVIREFEQHYASVIASGGSLPIITSGSLSNLFRASGHHLAQSQQPPSSSSQQSQQQLTLALHSSPQGRAPSDAGFSHQHSSPVSDPASGLQPANTLQGYNTVNGQPTPATSHSSSGPMSDNIGQHCMGHLPVQLAFDWVLKAEEVCVDHIALMTKRTMEGNELGGHTFMHTCPPTSHLINHPDEPHPHQLPNIGTAALATQMGLRGTPYHGYVRDQGEIYPVMALKLICRDYRYGMLTADHFKELIELFKGKFRCYGFGAVIEAFEIRRGLDRFFLSHRAEFEALKSVPVMTPAPYSGTTTVQQGLYRLVDPVKYNVETDSGFYRSDGITPVTGTSAVQTPRPMQQNSAPTTPHGMVPTNNVGLGNHQPTAAGGPYIGNNVPFTGNRGGYMGPTVNNNNNINSTMSSPVENIQAGPSSSFTMPNNTPVGPGVTTASSYPHRHATTTPSIHTAPAANNFVAHHHNNNNNVFPGQVDTTYTAPANTYADAPNTYAYTEPLAEQAHHTMYPDTGFPAVMSDYQGIPGATDGHHQYNFNADPGNSFHFAG